MDHHIITTTSALLPLSAAANDSSTAAELPETSPPPPFTTTPPPPFTSLALYIAGLWLWYVCAPLILLLGAFGNVMTIVIMRRMTSVESSVHVYFTAMAVVDLMYLSTSLVSKWLRFTFSFRPEASHDALCRLYIWLYTGSGTISGWYLVCMSAHRAVSVVWPHRVNVLCTRRAVLFLLTAVTMFFSLLYSHYLVGLERRQLGKGSSYVCIMNSESYFYFVENVFVYLDLAVYSLLPFLCLAMTNTVLVWKLAASVKEAAERVTPGSRDQVQTREKAARSVTVTVILVSVAFLVLTLPTSVSFIVDYFAVSFGKVTGYDHARAFFTSALCTLLGHSNSAVNFYLYCLTGRRFREKFVSIMCCGSNERRRDGSLSEVRSL